MATPPTWAQTTRGTTSHNSLAGLAGLAAACNANSDCMTFNWVPDGSLGWLKKGVTPTNLSAGSSVCYYVWSGTVSGTYSTSGVSNASACGFSNASACGFSPHPSSLITTYHHHGPHRGCPAVPGYTATPAMDHPEDSITHLPSTCMFDLATACTATPGCVSFNWKPDGSWGFLKSATSGSLAIDSSTANTPCFYVKSGRHWAGKVTGGQGGCGMR